MNLAPIILVAVIVAADASTGVTAPAWASLGTVSAIAIGGQAVLVGIAAFGARVTIARAGRRRRGGRVLLRGARAFGLLRWAVLGLHAAVILWLRWLDAVRDAWGDPILVDEVICLMPPVAALLAIAWAHYPIEQRLRQALLVRALDAGRPVYPLPSRGAHVIFQARSGLLLLGLPLLLIIGSAELIELIGRSVLDGGAPAWIEQAATLAAAGLVFITSPLLARLVLHVRSLPAGETRDELMGVCARHRVRVRDILVWDTGGAMINAAVMGLLGRLRYVLMTDALLDAMSRSQLTAVMAHEVAHVRRHHIPWLIVALLATLSAAFLIVQLPFELAALVGWLPDDNASWTAVPVWLDVLLLAAQVGLALAVFGWISRRFERQADTFAVQHLSGLGAEAAAPDVVTVDAVDAMRDALGRIAQLNTIDPRRSSWRHGSIAWRQAYLAELPGQPLRGLAIDRLVRAIKAVTAIVLVATLAAEAWLSAPRPVDGPPAARRPEAAAALVCGAPVASAPRTKGAGT